MLKKHLLVRWILFTYLCAMKHSADIADQYRLTFAIEYERHSISVLSPTSFSRDGKYTRCSRETCRWGKSKLKRENGSYPPRGWIRGWLLAVLCVFEVASTDERLCRNGLPPQTRDLYPQLYSGKTLTDRRICQWRIYPSIERWARAYSRRIASERKCDRQDKQAPREL